MIVLDASTKSLEVILLAAHTTNALPIIAGYAELGAAGAWSGIHQVETATNGTTAVTVITAPNGSTVTRRDTKYLRMFNADSVTHSVTLRVDVSGTPYIVWSGSVGSGNTLEYQDGEIRVVDGQGRAGIVIAQVPTNFTDLGDVPGGYGLNANTFVKVNAGATGLEFSADLRWNAGVLERWDGAQWKPYSGALNPTTLKIAAYTADEDELVRCNTTGGAFNVTLPLAPADGDTVGILDVYGTFGTNPVTLLRNGQNIDGSADDLTLDVDGLYVELQYHAASTDWRILLNPTIGQIPTATDVTTNIAGFGGLLSAADTTVQAALDTIDDKAQRISVVTNIAASAALAGGTVRNTLHTVDASGAQVDITLGALMATGETISFIKTDATTNKAVLDAGVGNTINGAQTYELEAQWQVAAITRTGAAAWRVTGTAGAAASGGGMTLEVTQAAHGFAVGQAVQLDGATWALARADAADTLGVGLVSVVPGVNDFTVCFGGPITGLAGLTAGDYYFVSSATAGAVTATEPVSGFSNPILLATSATDGVVLPYRPSGSGIVGTSILNGYQNVAQTTNLAANDHMKFDAIRFQSGSDITLDTTTAYTNGGGASVGRISLKGGRTYRLQANLRPVITSAGSDYVSHYWYDVTNSTIMGATSIQSAPYSALNNVSQSVVDAVYSPANDCLVEVRNGGVVGTLTQIYASSVTVHTIAAVAASSVVRSEVRVDTYNGYGSTGTCIRRFSNTQVSLGSAITYTQDATNGDYFTITESGYYGVTHTFDVSTAGRGGISVNVDAGGMTTNIANVTVAKRLALSVVQGGQEGTVSWSGYLQVGDVIRAHADGTTSAIASRNFFSICKVN